MQVIRKDPGKPPRLMEIPNTLKALQQAVGGPIETVTLAQDAVIICNEEGLLMGLAPNCSFLGIPFVGTILIVGRSGEEFCSLSHTAQQLILSQLGADEQP